MKKRIFLIMLLAVTLTGFKGMVRLYALPWPPMGELIVSRYGLQDSLFIVGGFRRAAADMAWVQWLQYVGGPREIDENRSRGFDLLKEMTLRVTRIDPYYHLAYLYGAGILAWSPYANRPDEALEILREGVRYNPHYWLFQSYIAAIIYKQQKRFPEMARLLEEGIRDPECPLMIKSILANYYKSQRQYAKAIRIWEDVLADDGGHEYHDTARRQIKLMTSLMQTPV